ncbi:MAG TPA: hypothetical protein VNO31_52910, partial [Umezawaea sp.]|nr:hypothetical protein [Umezawaea sp.]
PRPVVDGALLRALTSPDIDPVTTPERFAQGLARVRLRHLAVMWNELHPEYSALAVPVFTAGGRIAGALEARVRDPSAQLGVVQPALVIAGRSLTRELSSVTGRRGSVPGLGLSGPSTAL